ncbi:MAG: hypothetical protein LBR56_06155 [Sporomusaceae bacterium]|jgi:hypothetical protein|nr:hypothetical protein [Sporomusaceae bacterium]
MKNNRVRGTGNVIPLFPKQDSVSSTKAALLARVEDLRYLIEAGRIDNLLLACFSTKEGQVLTGYSNLNLAERMTLVGYIQADVVTKTVAGNIEGCII